MQIQRRLRYAVAGAIAAPLIAGAALVSYLGFHGIDVDTRYQISYVSGSTRITKEDIHWSLFQGTTKDREIFADSDSNGHLDFYVDVGDVSSNRNKLIVSYKDPESTYGDGEPTPRGMFIWLPGERQPFIKDKRSELGEYAPKMGDLILVMTEDEQRELNEKFEKAKQLARYY